MNSFSGILKASAFIATKGNVAEVEMGRVRTGKSTTLLVNHPR